ncbi:MAG: DUF4382 domain-containing protein [Candidatus Aenigmarchaeota archaeon]|nr:DUF4382 domain-containing protein [Candidatus Aenigmarchaeota archaeon]
MKYNAIIFALLSALLVAGCVQQAGAAKGSVFFTMADAAADMGAVSSVVVTVDSVRAHSNTQGWITVSSETRTYDLMQLKAQSNQVLLAEAQLDPGTYQQVRLDVSKVVVTDAGGEHEARLPSGELKIVGQLIVEANKTSSVTFDFIADESLHVTGNGQYVFAPVVQLTTRHSADVDVRNTNNVQIRSGTVDTDTKVGMDINGNVGVGVKIDPNVVINVGADGKVIIGVGAPPPAPKPKLVINITVEADNNTLYPVSAEVKKDATVRLTFRVREGTNSTGLEFRSEKFTTGPVLPGASATVEFTADKSFSYSTYFGGSSVKRAEGWIIASL